MAVERVAAVAVVDAVVEDTTTEKDFKQKRLKRKINKKSQVALDP